MRNPVIPWCLLLVFSAGVAAQETTSSTLRMERPSATTGLRVEEAIDPGVLEQIRVPVSTDTPSTMILMEREPVAGQSVTVDLSALRTRVGTSANIQVIREGRRAEESPPDRGTITLNRGDLLAVRRDLPLQSLTDAEGITTTSSPTIFYALDTSGRTRELGLIHRSAGLHWRADRARFSGELLVGLRDREDDRASGSLDGVTIPVQLLAAPGALDRTDLVLTSVGSPFQRVIVETELSADPFTVELISQLDPDLPRAELHVFRPRLALSGPSALQGLGVGEAIVTISGIDASLRPGEAITLDLDNGWLADRTVVVDETGTASTRIRSDWLGSATLRVVAPSTYEADPKEIRYTPPVRFLGATLIGAMFGALVLIYMLKRNESGVKRSYGTDWIIGVIIGSGATTMAYAGMKLPEWIPVPPVLAGEVAPFALAFICAAAGTAVIHSIVGAARPSTAA
jgi:hypothetical protein